MRADFSMEGVHLVRTDFRKAAVPATCGQAMEVPDLMAKLEGFLPRGTAAPLSAGGTDAARMPTPGAMISGCNTTSLISQGPEEEEAHRMGFLRGGRTSP